MFGSVRVGLRLLALCGLTASCHDKSKPDAAILQEADAKIQPNAGQAAKVIAQLERALAANDQFAAEDQLDELESRIPNDGRMEGFRQRVAALPGPNKRLTVDLGGGVAMDFVLIRPGSFTMGSDKVAEDYEKPAHKVSLTKPFYLGKYEVTQEQWEKVTGDKFTFNLVVGMKYPYRAKNPVVGMNWDSCQEFMAKLKNKAPGHTFRLPTEAEWEYACRAGNLVILNMIALVLIDVVVDRVLPGHPEIR